MASLSEQLLRTTDLPLAAYLQVQGMTPEGMEVVSPDISERRQGHPQGAWVFKETPTLRDLVDEFNNGEALVEPTAFQEQLNSTRRAMFEFLGIGS